MGAINIVLWLAGVALMAFGYSRARVPWSRYQALKQESANEERYANWRGGVRDSAPTGASVAMDLYRRQAQQWGVVAIVGLVMVFFGFFIH
jgi:hypothetical protein